MKKWKVKSRQSGTVFDLDGMRSKISDIELQMQSPEFWKDAIVAGKLSKELNNLKEEVSFWDNFESQLQDYLKLGEEELEQKQIEINQFKKVFEKHHIKIYLAGKYDRDNALIYIYS